MQLQLTRQAKHEGPQEFTDRCRADAGKVMCKDSDPAAQRIHRENVDRMLLEKFFGGPVKGNRKTSKILEPSVSTPSHYKSTDGYRSA
jgi:hypothetical protein